MKPGSDRSLLLKQYLLGSLLIATFVLPFVMSDYRIFQITQVFIYSIALLGLNLLTGYSGQISLGHGAFYAIGAYTAAILMDKFGVPYWLTIPIAGLICLIAGFLFGLPVLRLESLYLALATFALGVVTPQFFKHKAVELWTGGSQGIVIMKPEPPGWIPVNQDQWLYLFTLIILLVLFFIAWNLLKGRIGRDLRAIRDQPIAAEAMGINRTFFKASAFGISAMYTGIAGALGGIIIQFVAPDSFTIFLSISFVVGIVVGGLASLSGALYGALFIQFIPNLANEISKTAPWIIYGMFLMVCMFLIPQGISGLLRNIYLRLKG